MIFNNYLHYIRTKLKLPIKEAAASADVSVINLRAWEAGRSKPNISSILKLERAYKLPYGTLLNCLNGTTEKNESTYPILFATARAAMNLLPRLTITEKRSPKYVKIY